MSRWQKRARKGDESRKKLKKQKKEEEKAERLKKNESDPNEAVSEYKQPRV